MFSLHTLFNNNMGYIETWVLQSYLKSDISLITIWDILKLGWIDMMDNRGFCLITIWDILKLSTIYLNPLKLAGLITIWDILKP